MSLPRCCLNQYSGEQKRQYTDWAEADAEAERFNASKDDDRYASYICANCEFIHIGRTPKVIKFSHIVSNRETAALALELGPRAIYCMLAENMEMESGDKHRLLMDRWRKANGGKPSRRHPDVKLP